MLDGQHTWRRVELVDTVQGIIRGYIALWGSPDQRDDYGTWFDREKPPEMTLDFLPVPLKYEHSKDGKVQDAIIGSVTAARFDETGILFEAHLDKSSSFFERVVGELQAEELSTSSGTGHDAKFDSDGRFVNWSLFELSLTKNPAETRMPVVELIRSREQVREAGEPQSASGNVATHTADIPTGNGQQEETIMPDIAELQAQIQQLPEGATLEDFLAMLLQQYSPEEIMAAVQQGQAPMEEERSDAVPPVAPAATPVTPATPPANGSGASPLDMGAVASILIKLQDAERSAPAQPAPQQPVANGNGVTRADLDAMEARMKLMMQGEPPAQHPQQPLRGRPAHGRIEVGEPRRFAGLAARHLALGLKLMTSKNSPYAWPSEDFRMALSYKMAQEMKRSDSPMNDLAVRSLMPGGLGGEVRANEIMDTITAGSGLEMVGTAYDTSLWEDIRQDTIWQELQVRGMNVRQIPAGFDEQVLLVKTTDFTWYKIDQADDETSEKPDAKVKSSKRTTANVTLTVGKIGARASVSAELADEDGLINELQDIDARFRMEANEQIEYVLLNGDTATAANTNLNLIDGTPGTGLSQPAYLVLNGMLKLPIITTAAQKQDALAVAPSASLYRAAIKLLPAAERTNKRQRLLFIVDPDTYLASLGIPELKTHDVNVQKTVETGLLNFIWGVDVMESGQMATANSAGKIPAAGAALGRILLVRPDRWVIGWKRQIKIVNEYDARSDSYTIVASMRLGLGSRQSTGAATAIYNLAV